jgi:hypothetical protein
MTPIISLTTIPQRIEHIMPCLDSLLVQGYPVYLWVSFQVPQSVLDSGAKVMRVKDCGPITKLLPAFENGFKTVITADDDHIYGQGWAQGLLDWYDRLSGTVVCYRGRVFTTTKRYSDTRVIYGERAQVDMVTGVCGALYQRDLFSNQIFTAWEEWPCADDIVISGHLKSRDIPINVVPLPKGCGIERLPSAHIKPLSATNRITNDVGLARMYWK